LQTVSPGGQKEAAKVRSNLGESHRVVMVAQSCERTVVCVQMYYNTECPLTALFWTTLASQTNQRRSETNARWEQDKWCGEQQRHLSRQECGRVWNTKAPTSTTDPLSTDPVRAVTSQPPRLTDKDVALLRSSVVSGSCGPR